MDTIRISDVRALVQNPSKPCVSIYMPTHVSGLAGQQDRIRLKNLLDRAEAELAQGWLRGPEARAVVDGARTLAADPLFWDNRSHGLALFLAPDVARGYRLPVEFEEQVQVDDRFLVKPLLTVVSGGDRFLILALSQKKVRFFYADRHHIEEAELGGIAPMKEELNYTETDRGSQSHSAMRGGVATKQAAVFHGQGGEPDRKKADLEAYFRRVDAALARRLRDEQIPMLLAGVEYLLPIYRGVNHYSYLAAAQLVGNCDYLTPHELHERAWPIVEPLMAYAREETVSRYHKWRGTGKATNDIAQIVAAASQGRVDTLFVDRTAQRWGGLDDRTGAIALHASPEPGDKDLLELAAVQTLWNRGTVYAVPRDQMPEPTSAAAVMRY